MNEDKEQLEAQLAEARQIALDIEDGMRSRHWGHIRRKIEGWLAAEQKHLALLNTRLIRLPEDVEERNDTVKKIALLNQFLRINETVRDEHLAVISSLVGPELEQYRKQQSFVRGK